jgi:rare lipoprotein A
MPLSNPSSVIEHAARYASIALVVAVWGCSSTPVTAPRTVPPITPPPVDVLSIPEPTPKPVIKSALGNPAFYDVLGKRYFVLASASGFVERGIASWYGPGFHKERTSTGEPYDMYAMTAAHKTLPLPCYARVTNLRNGHSVVVYINDRGPFKEGRIVDLSYTAAAKLDMLRDGTAMVELRVVDANGSEIQTRDESISSAPLFIQAGAFKDELNAQKLADRIRLIGVDSVFVRKDTKSLFRVRIGPVSDVTSFDRVVAKLQSIGVNDARLAPTE